MRQPGEPGELIALKLNILLTRWIFFSWFSCNPKLLKGCCHKILPCHGAALWSTGETTLSRKGKQPNLSKPQCWGYVLWEGPWPACWWPQLHLQPHWLPPRSLIGHGGRSISPLSSWTVLYWQCPPQPGATRGIAGPGAGLPSGSCCLCPGWSPLWRFPFPSLLEERQQMPHRHPARALGSAFSPRMNICQLVFPLPLVKGEKAVHKTFYFIKGVLLFWSVFLTLFVEVTLCLQ